MPSNKYYLSSFYKDQGTVEVKTKIENVGIGNDYCIEIPLQGSPERGTLHILWPGSLNDSNNKQDRDCPILSIETLKSCGSFMRDKVYSLEIVTDAVSRKHSLCFRNMSVEMNNTRIHFFYETSECNRRALGLETVSSYKNFIKSFWVILRGNFYYYSTKIVLHH